MSDNFKFTKDQRLLTAKDYSLVFSNKNVFRFSVSTLTCLAISNNLDMPRLGVVIAKKNIKKAHDRNKVKRILREYFRLNQDDLPNVDIVILSKPKTNSSTSTKIREELDFVYANLRKYFKNKE